MNYVLTRIGISPVSWLISPNSACVTTMLLIFWRGVGWYIVFLLAGLRGLDPTYQEAGKVDGANAFQRAVHITIPQLRPIITFLLVLGLISGWQIFTEPALLFGGSGSMGGPSNAVLTPAIYIYEQGFTSLDYSYAAALSVLLALVTVTVSLAPRRARRSREGKLAHASRASCSAGRGQRHVPISNTSWLRNNRPPASRRRSRYAQEYPGAA